MSGAVGGPRGAGKVGTSLHWDSAATIAVRPKTAPLEIVVAGAIDSAEERLLQSIREMVNASALPRSRESVFVRAASETDKLPLLGAAVLIAQQTFDLPERHHADVDGEIGSSGVSAGAM